MTWASPLLPALLAITLGLLLGTAVVLGSPLAALAALLGVALLLLLLREPRAGLLAMVPLAYLLPFAVIPVRLGFQITALEAILGLTWTVVALRGVVHRDDHRVASRSVAVHRRTLQWFTCLSPEPALYRPGRRDRATLQQAGPGDADLPVGAAPGTVEPGWPPGCSGA